MGAVKVNEMDEGGVREVRRKRSRHEGEGTMAEKRLKFESFFNEK